MLLVVASHRKQIVLNLTLPFIHVLRSKCCSLSRLRIRVLNKLIINNFKFDFMGFFFIMFLLD